MPRGTDLRVLELFQEKCIGLAMLEALVHHGNCKDLTAAGQAQDTPQFVREALAQIDVQFKGIPSLRMIIVGFYSGSGGDADRMPKESAELLAPCLANNATGEQPEVGSHLGLHPFGRFIDEYLGT